MFDCFKIKGEIMAKTKKKALKRTNAKIKPSKAITKKNNAQPSLAATLEKELLKTLSKLHESVNKKLTLLTKEMKKLKTKLIKTVEQKRAPLKKKLEALQKELHLASAINLKASALKKHLQKFEKDWIKKQPKKSSADRSATKKKKVPAAKLSLKVKEKNQKPPLMAVQNSANVLPVSAFPPANQDANDNPPS